MSLPPQVIHVKRKRTEEGPVPSFLRIENDTKRHRSDAFLYRRHDPKEAAERAAKQAAALAAGVRPPTIHSSQPGDETRKPKTDASSSEAPIPAVKPPSRVPAEPRRFHLSRASLLGAQSATSSFGVSVRSAAGVAGIRKKVRYGPSGAIAAETAVFVERSKRQHRRRQQEGSARHGQRASSKIREAIAADSGVPPAARPLALQPEPVRPLPKRPSWRGPLRQGSRASSVGPPTEDTTTAATTAPETAAGGPKLPSSLVNRQWDTDMDQLARDMNEYTLEVIGRNLEQMQQNAEAAEAHRLAAQGTAAAEAEAARIAAENRKASYAKFKPKTAVRQAKPRAPAGHDEKMDVENSGAAAVPAAAAAAASASVASDDDSASETDEDDYVTETYVRVPGHEARKATQAAPEQVGLLIFDNEPDIEYFYGVEDDSDDELDDDEDENAENYYTHDYPEDEVASDDEFDRDAYLYRTGNASDMEEYSDEEHPDHDEDGAGGPGSRLPGAPLNKASNSS